MHTPPTPNTHTHSSSYMSLVSQLVSYARINIVHKENVFQCLQCADCWGEVGIRGLNSNEKKTQ